MSQSGQGCDKSAGDMADDREELRMKILAGARLAIACVALAFSACSPAAEKSAETGGVDVPTPHNPFFGTWEMTASAVAPWWDHKGDAPTPDPAMAKFIFAPDKSSGPPMLTCDKPRYTTNITPQRGLFQGNLPDAAKDAPALGFTNPDVIVMSFSCQSGTGDFLADFPMLDDATIMLGLDNVLYTFKRTAG